MDSLGPYRTPGQHRRDVRQWNLDEKTRENNKKTAEKRESDAANIKTQRLLNRLIEGGFVEMGKPGVIPIEIVHEVKSRMGKRLSINKNVGRLASSTILSNSPRGRDNLVHSPSWGRTYTVERIVPGFIIRNGRDLSKDDKTIQPPYTGDVVITADGIVMWDPIPMWDPRKNKPEHQGTPGAMPMDKFGRPVRYSPHRAIESNDRNCVTVCPGSENSKTLSAYDQGAAILTGLETIARQIDAGHLVED